MGERPDAVGRSEEFERLSGNPDDDLEVVYTDAATAGSEDSEEEAEQIEAEIVQTRAEMTETIDAIGEKLAPENIAQQAREKTVGRVEEMVSNAGYRAQEAGSGILDTIRQNPVPAAMAGIGIGWLILGRQRSTGGGGYSATGEWSEGTTYDTGYGRAGTIGTGQLGQAQQRASEVAGRAQARASDVGAQAQARATELADEAQVRASEIAGRAQQTAGQLAEQARWQAERARSEFDRLMQSNPLAVGVAAAAVGVVAGLAVPATQREHELLGETRDRVLDKAQQAAESAMDRVESSAQQGQ
jgi:ElaB/YqjD/DUF883 family membrane-anchored ribosome-binding protein